MCDDPTASNWQKLHGIGEIIDMIEARTFPSLQPLQELKSLRSLKLREVCEYLVFISPLTQLRELHLCNCDLIDSHQFASLTQLTKLQMISGRHSVCMPNVVDVISILINLEELQIVEDYS